MAVKKPFSKHPAVMLIDDSEIDNFINQKMMEGCHFADRIYVHTSGKSAIEFLKNLEKMGNDAEKLTPRIIFLDINMPIMDGFQFMEEYEKLSPELKKNTRVVMLTTSVNPRDIERAKNLKNVSQYINKPLSNSLLASL